MTKIEVFLNSKNNEKPIFWGSFFDFLPLFFITYFLIFFTELTTLIFKDFWAYF